MIGRLLGFWGLLLTFVILMVSSGNLKRSWDVWLRTVLIWHPCSHAGGMQSPAASTITYLGTIRAHWTKSELCIAGKKNNSCDLGWSKSTKQKCFCFVLSTWCVSIVDVRCAVVRVFFWADGDCCDVTRVQTQTAIIVVFCSLSLQNGKHRYTTLLVIWKTNEHSLSLIFIRSRWFVL